MSKIEQVIQYIASQDINNLGKTKLAKLLFFIDREIWLATGQKNFLGDEFIKKPKGPVPRTLNQSLGEMQDNDLIDIQDTPLENSDSILHKIILKTKADTSKILDQTSDREKKVIDYVIKKYRNVSADALSDLTHDSTWENLDEGSVMPYEPYVLMRFEKKKNITIKKEIRKELNASYKKYDEDLASGTLKTKKIDLSEVRRRLHS